MIGSQADLAVTLLGQLGLDTGDYILGKDLLAPDSRSFALYSYKNGIAMLTDSTAVGIDFTSNGYNFSSGPVSELHAKYARTQQQYIYGHYQSLSGKKIRDLRAFRK